MIKFTNEPVISKYPADFGVTGKKMIELNCPTCNEVFSKAIADVNYAKSNGKNLYCKTKCVPKNKDWGYKGTL